MASAAPQAARIDVGRVVGRGFTVLRGNFLPFLAAAMILCGIPVFGLYYLNASLEAQIAATDTVTAEQVMSGIGALVVTIITGCLLQGILSRSTLLAIGGRPADVRGSVFEALRLLLPILGVAIITAIGVGVGVVFLIVPGIVIYIVLIVAVPALIEERGGVTESLSRSVSLTAGSRLMIFLLAIVFLVAAYLLSLAIGAVFVAAAVAAGGLTPFLAALADGIDAAVAGMLAAVMISSLYVELRGIKDAATPESVAAAFDASRAPAGRISSNLIALTVIASAVGAMLLLSYVPGAPVGPAGQTGAKPMALGPAPTSSSAQEGPRIGSDPLAATRAALRDYGEGVCREQATAIRAEWPDIDFDSVCRCIGERSVDGLADSEIARASPTDQDARLRRAGRECFPESWPDARPAELVAARGFRYRADGVAACLATVRAAPGVQAEGVRSACECAVDGHMRSRSDDDLARIVPATWLQILAPQLERCGGGNALTGRSLEGDAANVAAAAQAAADEIERSVR